MNKPMNKPGIYIMTDEIGCSTVYHYQPDWSGGFIDMIARAHRVLFVDQVGGAVELVKDSEGTTRQLLPAVTP